MHVAHFLAELFGGGEKYRRRKRRDHYRMVKKHLRKHLTKSRTD